MPRLRRLSNAARIANRPKTKLVLPLATTINAAFLLKYKGPCVYEWVRGTEILYIGSTENLLNRLGTHHVVGIKEPLQEQDEIRIYHCDTSEQMVMIETLRISKIRPKYNKQIRDANAYEYEI